MENFEIEELKLRILSNGVCTQDEYDLCFPNKNKERDEFLENYENDHLVCPNCGEIDNYRSTLVGYILHMDDKENYKNLNKCTCMKCNDVHTKHERLKL